MRVTRSHLFFVTGILAGGAGLAVIVAPELLPPEVEQFRDVLDEETVSRFATGLAVFVVLVAIFRLLRPSPEEVDRSPIANTPPELVTADEANDVGREMTLAYERVLERFESPDHAVRLVAIYGRRAKRATEIEDEIEHYLQELATTAADTYAMSVGCDTEQANRAIESGQWTDDRVAAAFLATDLDSEVSFTAWERLNAWLAPERVFRARVQRVLAEVESYADSYLTYGEPVDGPSRTREGVEQPTSGERPATTGRVGSDTRTARADGGAGSDRADPGTRPHTEETTNGE